MTLSSNFGQIHSIDYVPADTRGYPEVLSALTRTRVGGTIHPMFCPWVDIRVMTTHVTPYCQGENPKLCSPTS
jgi:hypothetical protein